MHKERKEMDAGILSVLQASTGEIRYTFLFISYANDSALKYGRTAIIQLLVSCCFAGTHRLADITNTHSVGKK